MVLGQRITPNFATIFQIERIRAEYILMRSAGRIPLRLKILTMCKRLEPFAIMGRISPISDYFEWLGLMLCGIELLLVRILQLLRVGI
jgi:hypothetical protein